MANGKTFPEPSLERIREIKSLSAIEAVRTVIRGEFRIGEEDYLAETIMDKANVNCDESTMWDILHDAMDDETSPSTVLGRLAS